MKRLKTLAAVWLVLWATAARALPPVPDIRGWLVDELQKAQPDRFPGKPVRLDSGEISTFRFTNGNLLAFSEYMLFLASPYSDNGLVPVDSQWRLRCAYRVFIDRESCATAYEALLPSGPFMPAPQARPYLLRSAADLDKQLRGLQAAFPQRLQAVDWQRQMVVGVALGQEDAPCSVVSILNIREQPAGLEVQYLINPPPQVPGLANACDYPQAAFAILERSAKPVAFLRRLTRDPWELAPMTLP